jgi:ABC-type transport system substrate-binding protein
VPELDLYFIRDESVAEEIAEYLRQASIKANLVIRKHWCDLFRKILSSKTPLIFLPTGGYFIFDVSALLNLYFLMSSPRCLGSNTEIDRLLRQADETADTDLRRQLLTEA